MQELLSASSTRQLGPGGRTNRKWYFERLLVQVIHLLLLDNPLVESVFITTWIKIMDDKMTEEHLSRVQEMRCNLTLIPRAGVRDETAVLGRMKMAAALGIQFLDINNLPLRINCLPLHHAFVSPQSLYNIVTRHLLFQVCQHGHA